MSAYQKTPFKPTPRLLVVGHPQHLWGSFNDRTPPTSMVVTSVACSGDVATVGVIVKEGSIPVVAGFAAPNITIIGTVSASGAYNVTEVPISSVSINATTGIGTISFALTTANLATTTDGGQAISEQPQVPEALADGASVSVAAPMASSAGANQRTLSAQVFFPSLPTTVTSVTLQGSNFDLDSLYQDIATVASVAAGVVTGGNYTTGSLAWRFYRFNTTGASGGTNPSIVATLEC